MTVFLLVAFLLQTEPCPVNTQSLVVGGVGADIVVPYSCQISGSSSTRFDVVFIGEGFTGSDLDVLRFETKVGEAMKFLSVFPYRRCAFNFYWVRLVSKQSGSDHPLDDMNSERRCKDTALNSHFGDPNATNEYRDPRFLMVDDEDQARCHEVVDLVTTDWDQIVVLVNDATYGGAEWPGRAFVTVSIGNGVEHVLLHEMGHGFAGLGDEYGDPDSLAELCYPYGEPDHPNVTINCWPSEPCAPNDPNSPLCRTNNNDSQTLKWPVDTGVPVPTELDDQLRGLFPGVSDTDLKKKIGLWRGATGFDRCVYRPQFTCKMQFENEDFCKVCAGAIDAAALHACRIVPNLEVPLFADRRFRCIVGSIVRIPLPPCPKCLTAAGQAALDGLEFSDTDRIRVEIGPLPGVGEVRIIEVGGSEERVAATGQPLPPDPSSPGTPQPIFSVEFRVRLNKRYFIEFSPASCETSTLTFSIRVFVNGLAIRLP